MRRRKSVHPARYIAIAAVLLAAAGIGGYKASSTYFAQKQTNTASTITPPVPVKKPDPIACIDKLPSEIKFNQKLMIAAYSDQIAQLAPVAARFHIGGIIVMDAVSKEQLADFSKLFIIAPTIAVDQEGGTVQRYKEEGLLTGASDMVTKTPEAAYDLYSTDSQYLASLGITTNFAPVVDVESRRPSPLPGRMYSSDPAVVATFAGQAIKAMQQAKLQPVIKHFPGMGSASGNTDFRSATTDPLATLKERDFLPYDALSSLRPDVMIGNMIVPDLTKGQPAIWSPEAISLLRDMGYTDSVLYSDSLTAQAVPGTLESASLKTWLAGVDVALIVQTHDQTANLASYITAIDTAANTNFKSGAIDLAALNQSLERILTRKAIDPCTIELGSE